MEQIFALLLLCTMCTLSFILGQRVERMIKIEAKNIAKRQAEQQDE